MTRKLFALLFIQLLVTVVLLLGLRFTLVPVSASTPGRDLTLEQRDDKFASLELGAGQLSDEVEQDQTCTPDTPGMLSYWPLDDGQDATTFKDVVGDNDGSCSGINCPANSVGKIDSGFQFDSSDPDEVDALASDPSLNWGQTESFSFELWVNSTQLCTERKVFIGKYKDRGVEDGSWASWWVGCDLDDKAVFFLRDSTKDVQVITSTVSIIDGNWHHIVAGRDGSTNENWLFVDGVRAEPVEYPYPGNFISNNIINLGYYNVSPYYHFDGQLDEVAIYGRMLTEDEILAHYNDGGGQSYCIGPPTAEDDNYTVEEDSTESIFEVLLNDSLAPDSDGTLTIIAVGAGSAGGTITTDGSFVYYTPAPDYFGEETFTYTITDGYNNATAEVTVTVTAVSDPPEVVNPGDQQNTEGDDVSLQIVASDPDMDELTYSASGLPSGLSIDLVTGLISGKIAFGASSGSPYTVHVSVEDDDTPALSENVTFSWFVGENNSPLVINPGDQISFVGNNVSLQIEASDPDGHDLEYMCGPLPPGLSMDPETGLISGTLTNQSLGNWTVQVTVSDGDDAKEVSTEFNWTIKLQVFLPVISR